MQLRGIGALNELVAECRRAPRPEPAALTRGAGGGLGHLANWGGVPSEAHRVATPQASFGVVRPWFPSSGIGVFILRESGIELTEPEVLFGFQSSRPSRGMEAHRPIAMGARSDLPSLMASPRPEPASSKAQEEPIPYLALIRGLIEHEQVSAARRMLNALPMRLLSDPAVEKLRGVLALPRVVASADRDTDRRAEYEWLRTHGRAYRGQWVAVLGGGLVAAAPSLRLLRERLRGPQLPRRPLIHHLQ
jgi:hypothetical protein